MTYPPTPEHDKLQEVMTLSKFSQRLGEALDSGVTDRHGRPYRLVVLDLDSVHEERHWNVYNLNEALADLLGVDYKALMDEKDAVLAYVRRNG